MVNPAKSSRTRCLLINPKITMNSETWAKRPGFFYMFNFLAY